MFRADTERHLDDAPRAASRASTFCLFLVLAVASAVVWWAIDRGAAIRRNVDTKLEAAPLVGRWDWNPAWRILPAVVLGAIVVTAGPSLARRLRFRWCVVVTSIATSTWTVALAWSQGASVMIDPVIDRSEYWLQLPKLPPASKLLDVWAQWRWMRNQPVHIKGHPPGYVLVLKAMSHVGLGSSWAAAALSWAAAGVTAAAVVIAVRFVASPDVARRVAPFLVIAPYAVWMGTSADAVFAACGTVGVALVAFGLRRGGRVAVLVGALAGLVLAFSLYLSYGMVMFLLVPLGLIIGLPAVRWHARLRVVLAGMIGAVCVVATFAGFRFWWPSGLSTTRFAYWKGTAQFRPWGYFFVANIANAIIASGPAVIAGCGVVVGSALGRLRRGYGPRRGACHEDRHVSGSRVWLMPLAAGLAMLAANVSQLSKGETERIWLPFFVCLVPLVSALRSSRLWLGVQVVCALILQTGLLSKW